MGNVLSLTKYNKVGIRTLAPEETLEVHGDSGQLLTAADDFSDVIFSANNISGLPVIEACCDNTVTLGKYGSNTFSFKVEDGGTVLPVGTTSERGSDTQGKVRYNTTTSSFEGYSGANWGSLGGVKDVDQDTYIQAETSPAANNNCLDFYTAGTKAGCISGNALYIVDDITAFTSDKRFKCSIFTIQGAIEKIKNIRGVEFEWNRKYIQDCNIGLDPIEEGKTVGFIAQELEEVIPTAVREAPVEGTLCREVSWKEKYKTVKPEKITPLLVEAVKEQQSIIEKQQKQIDRLTCHVEILLGRCA
jgi:hypothetical protein